MNEIYIHVYEDKHGRPFTESAQVTFLDSLQELDDYHDTWTGHGYTYITTLIKRAPQGSESGPQYGERDMMDALTDFRREIAAERFNAPGDIYASAFPGGKL